jgi:hypothetical protein
LRFAIVIAIVLIAGGVVGPLVTKSLSRRR